MTPMIIPTAMIILCCYCLKSFLNDVVFFYYMFRVKRDLKVYEKKGNRWLKSDRFQNVLEIAKMYKAHGNLDFLIDKKDTRFLKGMFDRKEMGARINVLPDGRKLDKTFSLFSPGLVVHGEMNDDHWDVMYKNKGGTYSYVYALEKKEKFAKRKYKKVEKFERCFPKLKRNVLKGLKKGDELSLEMYTLLKTCMRVGNEVYFKAHKHRGLSTLEGKNIVIWRDKVSFNFTGKDGVPISICEKFPKVYVDALKKRLRNGFIFVYNNRLLCERDFKKGFKKYCGEEFYPHIVRSHYATIEAKKLLKKRKLSKKEVDKMFVSIASKLGHKKCVNGEWKDNFTVTVNHYIDPAVVERIKKRVQ